MGYYYGRSPDQVQRDNGTRFTFDKMVERYNKVVPLRGKRKQFDVRPMNERSRDWERVVKVNENEYYLTCFAWRYYELKQQNYKQARAITFLRNSDHDVLTIHTPRPHWQGANFDLWVSAFNSPSIFYFYDYNLPDGFRMGKYHSQNYVRHQQADGSWLDYTIQQGDIQFVQKHGEKEWKPLMVRREVVHQLDRTKTKAIREQIKPFHDYCMMMMDLANAESSYAWRNQVNGFMSENSQFKDWGEVFKHGEGDIPEHWFIMLQRYKYRIDNHKWRFNPEIGKHEYVRVLEKHKLMKTICDDVFAIAKPCKDIEVPLGKACVDRYRKWYR
jgi:hypothetical protein